MACSGAGSLEKDLLCAGCTLRNIGNGGGNPGSLCAVCSKESLGEKLMLRKEYSGHQLQCVGAVFLHAISSQTPAGYPAIQLLSGDNIRSHRFLQDCPQFRCHSKSRLCPVLMINWF